MVLKIKDGQTLDPRQKRTLKLLDQAAMDLLAEKDYRSITVQDISARAGLNRATFYAHFEDKYALYDFMVRSRLEELLKGKIAFPAGFSAENLRLLILVVCDFVIRLSGYFQLEAETRCRMIWHVTEFGPTIMIELRVRMFIYEVLLDWFEHQP